MKKVTKIYYNGYWSISYNLTNLQMCLTKISFGGRENNEKLFFEMFVCAIG